MKNLMRVASTFPRTLPLAVRAAIVGVFALFHGCAHGAEMPATASGLAYGVGFVIAIAACGVSLCFA